MPAWVQALTIVHVAISLVGIASGFVVAYGLLTAKRLDAWTALFLATTVLTSVTGFLFPFEKFTPGLAFGVISLILLPVAIVARYRFRLAGRWRTAYVITAMTAQYLNVFVLIVQSFQKIPALHALAPTQSEPPFAVAQLITLVAFIAITYLGWRRFHVVQR